MSASSLRMLTAMRWKLFGRKVEQSPPEASDSTFEATTVEDLPPGLAEALAAHGTAPVAGPGDAGDAGIHANNIIGHVGRYALKSVLGEGGLGTVYAAWDPLLSRPVAVKTLHLHLHLEAGKTEALDSMILNEARAAARLSHPHIVTVFDAGPSEQGIYIAMEPLRGRDLRHLLQEGWRPTPVEVAHLVRRVADALAYAHGKGVVHCDIKPANIFMVGRKQPKVLDFGIARVTQRDGSTVEGPVAGSPYYLAPEQVVGGPIDRRVDVYSLGVVMYELLTGQRAFTGATVDDITRAVLQDPTPVARKANPKVPAGLSAIARRAMARAPEERLASARHLASELRHWLDSQEAQALGEPPSQRRGRWAALLGVALTAGAVTAVWMNARSRTASDAPLQAAAPAASDSAEMLALPAPLVTANAGGLATDERWADTPATSASGAASLRTDADATASTEKPIAKDKARDAVSTARTDKERRKAEVKDKKSRDDATAADRPAVPVATGTVQLAISPWGEVEVDGKPAGTAPPLTRLTLPAGRHTITVRNGDFPAYVRNVEVDPDHPLQVKHRFGP